jgi:hypothetical protein
MEKFKWARAHMSAGRDRYDQTQAITTARGHVTEHRSPLVATMRVPLLPQPPPLVITCGLGSAIRD